MVPWSAFWDRNLFVERLPSLGDLLLNPFVRGAVSGVGIVCVVAALVELGALWRARATETPGNSLPASGADVDLRH